MAAPGEGAEDVHPDELAGSLERFVAACDHEAPAAVATLRTLRDEWLVSRSRDAAARLETARRVEGLHGGLGSVNDDPWSAEAAEAKELPWLAARAAARIAWRDLGHESHDPASFVLHAVGSRVRTVPGGTLLVKSDASRAPVRRGMERREWEVTGVADPDVTGMPLHSLRSGNRFLLARHDALKPVGPGRG